MIRIGDRIVNLQTMKNSVVELVEYTKTTHEVIRFVARDQYGHLNQYQMNQKDKKWMFPII